MLIKNKALLLIGVLMLALVIPLSCTSESDTSFEVYLLETNELVISGEDIEAFDPDYGALELNDNGIKRWNSFITYSGDVPKLSDGLFNKDFILYIGSQEICRGKFWSGASSGYYSGIIIVESLGKLSDDHNILMIRENFSTPQIKSLYTDLISDLSGIFKRKNLLE